MRIPTDFDICIVCMNEQVGDWEHIIPSSIGGRLQAKMLCDKCNHQVFGSKLVSKLNQDPRIILALEYLKPEYPILFKRLLKRAKYVGGGADGLRIYGIEKDSDFQIISSSETEGVSIHDTEKAKNILRKMLEKDGLENEIIELWVEEFSLIKEDKPLQIPTGETYIKRKVPKFAPDLSTGFVDERLPALIAYEYLSLFIGNQIYNSEFEPVRKYLLNGDITSKVSVECLQGKEYDVFHEIYVKPNHESFNIYIRFFRWLVFKVEFHGYNYIGPDSIYREQLVPQKSLLALTRETASQGLWLSTQSN